MGTCVSATFSRFYFLSVSLQRKPFSIFVSPFVVGARDGEIVANFGSCIPVAVDTPYWGVLLFADFMANIECFATELVETKAGFLQAVRRPTLRFSNRQFVARVVVSIDTLLRVDLLSAAHVCLDW